MSLQVCQPLPISRDSVMSMPDSALALHQPLTPSQIADLRLAASTMTGAKRRAFEAEMALKYCEGNPLQAEITFGWSRRTVALGLAERRTGIRCLGPNQLSAAVNAGKTRIRRWPRPFATWPKRMRNKTQRFARAWPIRG